MGAGRDMDRDLGEMQVHGVGVAEGQDETGRLAFLRADRPEDIGGLRTLIMRRRRARPSLRPASRDLVFLADPSLVGEPDLYRRTAREGRSDLVQLGGKAPFLKPSIASGSWSWCFGRV